MRKLVYLVVAAVLVSAIPLTCHYASRAVQRVERPRYAPGQRAALRKAAQEAVSRYEALYGHLPREQWPEQPRATYEHARAYLAELDASGE